MCRDYTSCDFRPTLASVLGTALDRYQAMDMTFWRPETEAAVAQMEGR